MAEEFSRLPIVIEYACWTGVAGGRQSPQGLRTVAQSRQNRRASCLRYLLLSMTLQIRRQDGATPDCTLSSLAGDQNFLSQMFVSKRKGGLPRSHSRCNKPSGDGPAPS